ncbi:2-oxoglutarate-Fe(II) type oxidoreductase hxnY-like [Haliotis rubra]|uniref:2-oxoglutarate-Fe(II) type oxidoreductase hxnY-like n=1 Tax=Haliotis rubra TaxID=36100 RepID=UPI001EE5E481|nr:2-oxoglutarate-Fe(II) type oxidoreductase hxnY-like [Haliotis rubra]
MMETNVQLPVIDLKKAQDNTQRLQVAGELVTALETVGFLYVDNAPGVDLETLLENTKRLFSLSSEEKRMISKHKWNPINKNRYRGYFPLQPDDISYKEGFEIGVENCPFNDPDIHPMFTEPNLWPRYMDGFDEFLRDMQQYYKAVLNTGTEILRLLALGSGLDEYWFESMFLPDTLSTLRLLHYPLRSSNPPDTAKDGDTVLCCSEHSDSGFVTLLSTFHYRGLQIFNQNDKWVDVEPRPNSLVMNIGDILSKTSNGRFKATRHRVVETGMDRYSVPFFFEPRYGAEIGRMMPFKQVMNNNYTETNDHEFAPENSTKYGPWLIGKMQQFAEYKDILKS